jgi:hypothetical protein
LRNFINTASYFFSDPKEKQLKHGTSTRSLPHFTPTILPRHIKASIILQATNIIQNHYHLKSLNFYVFIYAKEHLQYCDDNKGFFHWIHAQRLSLLSPFLIVSLFNYNPLARNSHPTDNILPFLSMVNLLTITGSSQESCDNHI